MATVRVRDRDSDPPGFAYDVIRELRRILRLPQDKPNAPPRTTTDLALRAFASMVTHGEVSDRIRIANSRAGKRPLESYIKLARKAQAARARLPAWQRLLPLDFADHITEDIARCEAILELITEEEANPKWFAAELAVALSRLRNLPVSTDRKGTTCELAALLYSICGESNADLFHYVRVIVQESKKKKAASV